MSGDQIKARYKRTEVGVIPEDWFVRRIYEVAEKRKTRFDDGDWIEAEHITDKGFRLIQTGNIGIGCFVEKDLKKYIYKTSFDKLKCKELVVGDLLICRLAEPAGRACLLPELGEEKVITSVDVTIFRPKPEDYDRGYLVQYLSTPEWFFLVNEQVGGTTHKRIARGALGTIPIPIPASLNEQRAIATLLSDVDALIAQLDQLIAKKRLLKQATEQQLLTGKIRLPGFSGDWEVKRLGDVANFFKGKGLPKSAITSFGAEPCIHYGELFTQYTENIREVISRTNDSRNVFRSVKNDVLMPTSDVTPKGLAKASCIKTDGVILGGDILIIRTDNKYICGTFLSHVIRSQEEQVLQLVTGTTVFHLYGSDMKKFIFSVPTLLGTR